MPCELGEGREREGRGREREGRGKGEDEERADDKDNLQSDVKMFLYLVKTMNTVM